MKIHVGSTNPVKIDAVREVFGTFYLDAIIIPLSVSSGVSSQPMSLDETVQGAILRAKGAFNDCDYSVGIEGGLMRIAQVQGCYLDTEVAVVYDGKKVAVGLSPAYELPERLMREVLRGKESDKVAYHLGLTKNANVKHAEGVKGLITGMPRKEFIKIAIQMALSSVYCLKLLTRLEI